MDNSPSRLCANCDQLIVATATRTGDSYFWSHFPGGAASIRCTRGGTYADHADVPQPEHSDQESQS